MVFEPLVKNWFFCETCDCIAYHFDCCGNCSCSGSGCDVCCYGPGGLDGPMGVVLKIINDGTCPPKEDLPIHKKFDFSELEKFNE